MGVAVAALLAVAVAVLGVFGAAVSRVLADDLKAWTPRLTEWLIHRAVARLSEDRRDRLSEEWRSHVDEVPGTFGKLIVALGYSRAARALAPASSRPKLVFLLLRIIRSEVRSLGLRSILLGLRMVPSLRSPAGRRGRSVLMVLGGGLAVPARQEGIAHPRPLPILMPQVLPPYG